MTTLLRQSRDGGGGRRLPPVARRGVRVHLKGFTTINIGDCNGEGSDCDNS